jgi:hypothetical protein
MRLHSSIALAAMSVMLAMPVVAQAESARHSHKAASEASESLTTTEQLRLAQEQISQLQAQLNMLASKLDQTAAAVSVATTASTKADAVAAKVDAVKVAEVKTEKAVDAVSWASGTKVSGRAFLNASDITAHNAAGTRVQNDGAFQLKRAYISVDHTFNKVFSANITTDVDQLDRNGAPTNGNSGGPLNTAKGYTVEGLYVKNVYLQAKIDPALIIRFGEAPMAWVPFVEDIYGYRHIEKTLTDLNAQANSTDWGVHVSGKFLNDIVSYQVSAVAGDGYKAPQATQHIDIESRLSASYMGFTAGIGGYSGKLGQEVDTLTNSSNPTTPAATPLTATRLDALAAYKGKLAGADVTIGGEWFAAKNIAASKSVAALVTGTTPDRSRGYSLFASVSPIAKWSVFGRYDWIRASRNTGSEDRYFNLGLQYEPVKTVDLALVYKHDSAPLFGAATYYTGGNLGGQTNTSAGSTSRSELGLYAQVKF